VGDGAVGKTTFLFSFAMDCVPSEYVPTTFDNYSATYTLEGREIALGLWDTAGQSDFAKLRPISYKMTDVYLVFFSVVNPTSFENVKEHWIHEVKQYSPDVPFFLIGTQIDQRDDKAVIKALGDKKEKPITEKEGKKLSKDLGAVDYIEISAKDKTTYGDLWEEVLRYTINEFKSQKKPGKHCWSIHCPLEITTLTRVTCQGKCKLTYCKDCIEIWDDGWKGCPQCVMYEKKLRHDKGKKVPEVKKRRVSPAERAMKELEKEAARLDKAKKKALKDLAKQGKTVNENGEIVDRTENDPKIEDLEDVSTSSDEKKDEKDEKADKEKTPETKKK
jgi:small GTP-binding protein